MWPAAALETLIYHELRAYNEVSRKHRPISYYRTPGGVEVDFIIETAARRPGSPPRALSIEAQRGERRDRAWDKPMRSLAETSGIKVERLIGVYCGPRAYQFDNIKILPMTEFVKVLFAGGIF
jgi:uncharacterized protein